MSSAIAPPWCGKPRLRQTLNEIHPLPVRPMESANICLITRQSLLADARHAPMKPWLFCPYVLKAAAQSV